MPEKGYDICIEQADELAALSQEIIALRTDLNRMRGVLLMPLTSAELKLVDKNCNWIAFKHAWNAVIKQRLGAYDDNETS